MKPLKIYSEADIKDECDLATGQGWPEVVTNNIQQIDLMNNRVDDLLDLIDDPEKLTYAQNEIKLYLFQLNHGFINDYYDHNHPCELNTFYKARIEYSIKKFQDALALLENMINGNSKSDNAEKQSTVQYPDKYYAWYHKILIKLGKADPFLEKDKQGIINYGRNKYQTKSGFYQAFNDFDIDSQKRMNGFVEKLSEKDKKKWKSIIIEISNNDADVINHLKNFPN